MSDYISQQKTSELKGEAAKYVHGALKKFNTQERMDVEDIYRRQNTNFDKIADLDLSEELMNEIQEGRARIMDENERKTSFVEVMGVEMLPPKYGPDLAPVTMKVYTVEVHQFIEWEGYSTPDFISSKQEPVEVTQSIPANWPERQLTGYEAPSFYNNVRSEPRSEPRNEPRTDAPSEAPAAFSESMGAAPPSPKSPQAAPPKRSVKNKKKKN